MKMHWKLAGILAIAAGICPQAKAAITVVQFDSTAGFTKWIGSPNAADTTGPSAVNIAGFNSPEGNFGGSPVSALSQSFAATTSGLLTDAQIIVTGTTSGTINLALYDAGPAAGSPLADTGSQAYGNTTGVAAGGTSFTTVSNNLLGADSTGVTLPGFSIGGSTSAEYDFKLAAEGVNLVAGEEYIFEVNTPSSSALLLDRMANNAIDYAAGQAFRARAPLNGNPDRDFALAITVAVPEPTSIGLIGLASMGLLARRRKA